jgi:hypothetical protein
MNIPQQSSQPQIQQPAPVYQSIQPSQSQVFQQPQASTFMNSPSVYHQQQIEKFMPTQPQPQSTQLSQRDMNVYGISTKVPAPRSEDDTYIKNKQLQILDYNSRVNSIKNERSILSSGADLKQLDMMRTNIIGDISTRPGVTYVEKTNQYIIPVDAEKYNAGNYKPFTIASFASLSF